MDHLLFYTLCGWSHRCHRALPENVRTLNYGPPFWYIGDMQSRRVTTLRRVLQYGWRFRQDIFGPHVKWTGYDRQGTVGELEKESPDGNHSRFWSGRP
jgi:hypothetical protein